jgi:hypothetical protein
MANPKPDVKPYKYYFYDDARMIIYYSDVFPDDLNLVYLGTSNAVDPKKAAAFFTQTGKISSGFTIQEYV